MTQPLYIAIEGVIGVGKTTLARLLQPHLNAELVLEVFEENPFLAPFYADPERYAFQTQIFFLLSRYRQQQTLREQVGRSRLISDYLFDKDRLFARLNLQGDELNTYETLYEALSERIPRPDLVVYLRASVDTLMARIAARDRPYERNMPRSYIAALHRVYDDFFQHYDATPLLVIETDDVNVVANPRDLQAILQRVRTMLELHAFQPALPAMEQQVASYATAEHAPDHVWETPEERAHDPFDRYVAVQAALGTLATLLQARKHGYADREALRHAIQHSIEHLHELATDLGLEIA
nr:deoxynucleoside kinase [Ardenticatena sp.]